MLAAAALVLLGHKALRLRVIALFRNLAHENTLSWALNGFQSFHFEAIKSPGLLLLWLQITIKQSKFQMIQIAYSLIKFTQVGAEAESPRTEFQRLVVRKQIFVTWRH